LKPARITGENKNPDGRYTAAFRITAALLPVLPARLRRDSVDGSHILKAGIAEKPDNRNLPILRHVTYPENVTGNGFPYPILRVGNTFLVVSRGIPVSKSPFPALQSFRTA